MPDTLVVMSVVMAWYQEDFVEYSINLGFFNYIYEFQAAIHNKCATINRSSPFLSKCHLCKVHCFYHIFNVLKVDTDCLSRGEWFRKKRLKNKSTLLTRRNIIKTVISNWCKVKNFDMPCYQSCYHLFLCTNCVFKGIFII